MSSGSKKRKEATKRSNQHAEFMQKVPKLWSFCTRFVGLCFALIKIYVHINLSSLKYLLY
jgi:hypothetical protein